jgi:hypothetical protein
VSEQPKHTPEPWTFGHATEVAENREREIARKADALQAMVSELEAENAKLRTLYAAAWEECDCWRRSYFLCYTVGMNVKNPKAEIEQHDDLRREAGL